MFPKEPRATGAIISLALLAALSACSTTTAAGRVTLAGTQTLSAVQLDQYRRDARSTQAAQDATIEARAQALAATASVSTQTQIAVTQRAGAQATAAVITQLAVATQGARDATRQAGQDADATATAQAQNNANSTATAQTAQQSTATAQIVGTQTALDLSVQASAVERAVIVNRWGVVFLAILAAVCIWALYALMRAMYIRAQLVHYGPNRNPLVLLPNGAVYNPISNTYSGDEIPPELQARLQTGLVELLAIQAQHNPHPPGLATKKELRLGPFSANVESCATVEKVTAPSITPPLTSPRISAPEQKPHYMFIQGQAVSEPDRELCDLREMIERGALQGFTRQRWLGHTYESGHAGTRERYDHLIDVLTQAGVLEPAGKTWRLAVPVEQAVAALNLERTELG